MATIVNNPSGTDTGSGAGLIVGIIVGILVILGLIFYVVPAMRGGAPATPDRSIDVNVDLPGGGGNTSGGATEGAY